MDLIVDKGTVYSERYLTVRPVFHDTISDHEPWRSMVEWCVTNLGPTPKDGVWTPSARWYVNNAKFWFQNDKDLTMFILRWS